LNNLRDISTQHRVFGYSGLIPFVGFSLYLILIDNSWQDWLISYAALIFSFLGGILWAFSLNGSTPRHCSWVSIGAMLWAWLWLVCNPQGQLIIAAFSFVALWLYERRYLRDLYPESFYKLRTHLSLTAATSLLLSGIFIE
jgi:hypothetical protein